METKAHYALVGFFAIAFVVAAALFTVWLGQLQFDQTYNEFDVRFEGPVRGLSVASEVRFNGIKVGEVTRLGLDPSNSSVVLARIRIAEEIPVTQESVAQLEPLGLTGLNYIQITSETPDGEPIVAGPGEELPVLRSERAQIESLIESSESIAESASDALRRANDLLTPENIAEIKAIITNLRILSDQLADTGEDGLIPLTRGAIAELGSAASGVTQLTGRADALMANEVAELLRETANVSREVERAAGEAAAILEDSRGPIVRFTNEGLDELTLAIADMRRVLGEIEAIAAGVEDNPAAFVAGARREEVEIPR
jgi:phospholipid/cholesterol/gamma-HCH transport system substrate-binding protein